MPKAKNYDGGCLCGQVRFSAVGPALKPHTCSCKMCQRHSGSLTVSWVELLLDRASNPWNSKFTVPELFRLGLFAASYFDHLLEDLVPNLLNRLLTFNDRPGVDVHIVDQ